jgi:hypothetical protein
MMCHKIGLPPISTMGFGLTEVSSEILVPSPPARMTAFTTHILLFGDGPVGTVTFRIRRPSGEAEPKAPHDGSPSSAIDSKYSP